MPSVSVGATKVVEPKRRKKKSRKVRRVGSTSMLHKSQHSVHEIVDETEKIIDEATSLITPPELGAFRIPSLFEKVSQQLNEEAMKIQDPLLPSDEIKLRSLEEELSRLKKALSQVNDHNKTHSFSPVQSPSSFGQKSSGSTNTSGFLTPVDNHFNFMQRIPAPLFDDDDEMLLHHPPLKTHAQKNEISSSYFSENAHLICGESVGKQVSHESGHCDSIKVDIPPPPPPPPSGLLRIRPASRLTGSNASTERKPNLMQEMINSKAWEERRKCLKKVETSPGGTPRRPIKCNSLEPPAILGPADLIALALQRKFRFARGSPAKENREISLPSPSASAPSFDDDGWSSSSPSSSPSLFRPVKNVIASPNSHPLQLTFSPSMAMSR